MPIVAAPTVQSALVLVQFLRAANLLFLTVQSAPVLVQSLLNPVRVNLAARLLVVRFRLVLAVNPVVLILALVSRARVVRVLLVVNLA